MATATVDLSVLFHLELEEQPEWGWPYYTWHCTPGAHHPMPPTDAALHDLLVTVAASRGGGWLSMSMTARGGSGQAAALGDGLPGAELSAPPTLVWPLRPGPARGWPDSVLLRGHEDRAGIEFPATAQLTVAEAAWGDRRAPARARLARGWTTAPVVIR